MGKNTKNILVNAIYEKEFRRVAPLYLKGKLVDIGCGEKPTEKYLSSYVSEHIGVDHPDTQHDRSRIDRSGTAYQIPAGDGEFDSAICTAVLEHLEEPDKAIKEAGRVLKQGGCAVYSVPLFWHLHEEPRDFYRYTKYGLKYLFEKNGFEILELVPLSGFWVTFGQEFVYYLWRFRGKSNWNPLRWIIPPIGLLVQGIAYLLHQIDRSPEFTWMYIVVVRKK